MSDQAQIEPNKESEQQRIMMSDDRLVERQPSAEDPKADEGDVLKEEEKKEEGQHLEKAEEELKQEQVEEEKKQNDEVVSEESKVLEEVKAIEVSSSQAVPQAIAFQEEEVKQPERLNPIPPQVTCDDITDLQSIGLLIKEHDSFLQKITTF